MSGIGRRLSVVPIACGGWIVLACSAAPSSTDWGAQSEAGPAANTAGSNGTGDGGSSARGGGSGAASSSGSSSGGSTPGGSSSGGQSSSGSSGSSGSSSGGRTTPGADASTTRDASGSADVSNPSAASDGGLDAVRQLCVDTINMYRATLNLPPLMRATPSDEACSDMGAMKDGSGGGAHSSAGMCPGFGAQDSCPQLPVGGGQTLESSLKQCLAQMWAEGPPPGTVQACIMDYTGCFLQHGHYINMSSSTSTVVSCGFYMVSGNSYWGNQDFK
jgi:hypothetical protein